MQTEEVSTAHIHYTYHAFFTGITHEIEEKKKLFTIRTAAFIKMAVNQ